jgi:hypothetical protein
MNVIGTERVNVQLANKISIFSLTNFAYKMSHFLLHGNLGMDLFE